MSTPPPNRAKRLTDTKRTTPLNQTHASLPAPPSHEQTAVEHDASDTAVEQSTASDPLKSTEMTSPLKTAVESAVDHNLMSLRTALILVLATGVALMVGFVSFEAGSGPWKSVLEGGAAWVAAVVFSHQVLVQND